MKASAAAILVLVLLAGACTDGDQPRAAATPTQQPTVAGVAVGDPHPANPRAVGRTIVADVDGDGHPDRARLWLYGPNDDMRKRVAVITWTGRTIRSKLVFAGGYRGQPKAELLGSADVNGDGRFELVMYSGGNTIYGATILTAMDNRLRYVRTKARSRYPEPMQFTALGFSCMSTCSHDATCQLVDGESRLIHTAAHPTDAEGNWLWPGDDYDPPGRQFAWSVEVYDLRGRTLILVDVDEGIVRGRESLPAEFQWKNDLRCGTAWSGIKGDRV